MKRDLRMAEEEEKWREKANNRDQWKEITKVALQRSDEYTSLTPTQGKPEEEQDPHTYLFCLFSAEADALDDPQGDLVRQSLHDVNGFRDEGLGRVACHVLDTHASLGAGQDDGTLGSGEREAVV